MLRQQNPLLRSAVTVFGFWWLFFTLRDFSMSPLEVIRNWAYVVYSARLWAIGGVAGAAAGAWLIWYKRAGVHDSLIADRSGNMHSTLGRVPVMAPAPARISDVKMRLPLTNPVVNAWLESAKDEHAEYVDLFLAVWDTYSAHRDWPASHRKGGHNNRRLWEHCLAVVETALKTAPLFKYAGVTIKSRGIKDVRSIIQPLDANYVFNAVDPLIPILALAHDIGKLEAYKLKDDGTVATSETSNGQAYDDLGVHHDALGARILARIPEYWKLPASDRRILNLVIAYYHHPSSFPVERNGLSIGDRISSLLQFLIQADKETGKQESGITDEEVAEELTEDEATAIYNAFVEIVTEHGRINGIHGDTNLDSRFTIGAKHDGLIVIRERPLRDLLHAKLQRSVETGPGRYKVPLSLLQTLIEKGLLYTVHNGSDFTNSKPMWNVDFRNSRNAKLICEWPGCIIIKVTPAARELDLLNSLPDKKSRMRINTPSVTHVPNIPDPLRLQQLTASAFGDEVAKKLRIPKGRGDLSDVDEDAVAAQAVASAAANALPATTSNTSAATPVASPAPAPAAKSPQPVIAPAVAVPAAANSSQQVQPVQPAPVQMPAPQSLAPAPVAQAPEAATPQPQHAVPISADNTPPWESEEPVAPASSAEAEPAEATGLDASDVPDMEGAGDDDGDDARVAQEPVDGVEGGLDDMFADFPASDVAVPSAPIVDVPAPVSPATSPATRPAEPELGHSPRDTAILDKLRQPEATVAPTTDASLIPKNTGRTIRDEDVRARDYTKGDKAKKAMQELMAAAGQELTVVPAERKKKRSRKEPLTVEALQQMVESKRVPVSGEREGHSWVFQADLSRVAGADAFLTAQTTLKLPVHDGGRGMLYVGIPLRTGA